jgi:hypothetical protein
MGSLPPVDVSVRAGTFENIRGLLIAVFGSSGQNDEKARKEAGESNWRDSRWRLYWLTYQ